MGRGGGKCNRGRRPGTILARVPARIRACDGHDPGRMARAFEKPHQVLAADRRGHGVDQRMGVDGRVPHQFRIEHHRDAARGIVHDAKRRHRAGHDPQSFKHRVGRTERKPAAGPQPPVQRFELDCGVLERRDEEQRAFLVLQEQVLGMATRDGAAQGLRLLHGVQRRMRHRRVGDPKAVEGGDQVFGRCGHADRGGMEFGGGDFLHDLATVYRGFRPWLQSPNAFRYRNGPGGLAALPNGCGCSSGVEHDLAKVGVEGSNPFARSNT